MWNNKLRVGSQYHQLVGCQYQVVVTPTHIIMRVYLHPAQVENNCIYISIQRCFYKLSQNIQLMSVNGFFYKICCNVWLNSILSIWEIISMFILDIWFKLIRAITFSTELLLDVNSPCILHQKNWYSVIWHTHTLKTW